jgi:putative endonuclease
VSCWKRMSINRKKLGAWGERIAREHIEKLGYQVIETNFRCHEGEIDIIAQEGEQLVFVEVRTRRGLDFGSPEESITVSKRKKLVEVANAYLQSHEGLPSWWRIDVVAVELGPGSTVSRVELIQNAVSGDS